MTGPYGSAPAHSSGTRLGLSNFHIPAKFLCGIEAERERLRRLSLEQRERLRRLQAQHRHRRPHLLRQQMGRPHDQRWFWIRTYRQRKAWGRAVPDDRAPKPGRRRAPRSTGVACRAPTAITRVTRVYNSGDIHTQSGAWGCSSRTSWTVGRNVTLNLGFRSDKEEYPFVHTGEPGNQVRLHGQDLAASGFRVGRPRATVKWKGYGSFGIFYDTSKLEMPRGLFGSEHSVTYYYTLDTFDWPADSVRPSADVRAVRALARSSSRWIFATPPTRPTIS